MIAVDSIIDSRERKELAEAFAERRWALAPPAPSQGRFRALFSAWEIDAVCRFVPLAGVEDFRLHFHGMRVKDSAYRDAQGRVAPALVRDLVASGVSLNMSRIENYSNAVLALSRILEAELRAPIQINFYHTPQQGQGLGSHIDDHDVLVLQLQGQKQWQLDGAGVQRTLILNAGDWLYLPRGIRHDVRNCGLIPSAHFTVGFHRERKPSAFRAFAAQIAAGEVPDRDALEAADADTVFEWRGQTVTVTASENTLQLDLAYRRSPLRLYSELEPIVERMAQAARFRPRDLGFEDIDAVASLGRFLACGGFLSLAALPVPSP